MELFSLIKMYLNEAIIIKAAQVTFCWMHFLIKTVCKKRRCFIVTTFQLCFKLCHPESPRK